MVKRAAASRKADGGAAAAAAAEAAAASAAASAAADASASASPLERVSSEMDALLSSPVRFFAADASVSSTCMRSTKHLYDLAVSLAPPFLQVEDAVKELRTHARPMIAQQDKTAAATKGKKGAAAAPAQQGAPFTSEQIFAQLALHTTPLLKRMEAQMKVLRTHVAEQEKERVARQAQREQQAAPEEDGAEDDEEDGEEDAAAEDDEDEAGEDEDEEEEEEEGEDELDRQLDAEADEAEQEEEEEDEDAGAKKKGGKSQAKSVDTFRGRGGVEEDAFFSLEDMEKFADQFEDDDDAGDIDLGEGDEDDQQDDDEDEEERGEDDDEEEDEEADDALDLDALKRRAIRAKHDASLKPLARPLREELADVDLEEDVGDIDLKRGERYEDFFDPPPEELVRAKGAVGKRGRAAAGAGAAGTKKKGGARSMEDLYAEEDADETTYQDADYTDEFGPEFRALADRARAGPSKGLLGDNGLQEGDEEGEDAEDEEALANSKPVDGSSSAAAAAAAAPADVPQSNYEKQSAKLASQIALLEQKIIQPREWAQLGEVSGKARPVDALLSTHLEFDHAGKVAQPVTQQYSEELEAMIRRRIIEERFDDVVRRREDDVLIGADGKRKAKGAKAPVEEVSGEKSAIGLGEVYEQEAQATLAAAQGRASVSEEKLSAAHAELSELMGALFHKLDSLCNFHFTPRSIHKDELAIRTHAGANTGAAAAANNVSSISLEENMPMHMSSAAAQAPQEVLQVRAEQLVGATERESAEKQASRRRVKAQKKKKAEALAAREAATIASMGAAARGNAEQGVLRKAISTKEMIAATTARNVIQAGGKGAGGSGKKGGAAAGRTVAHGQNTKFGSSGAFFGKMNSVAAAGSNKKR
jgi:U3 small nucleolar RNA-associated protein MPP10